MLEPRGLKYDGCGSGIVEALVRNLLLSGLVGEAGLLCVLEYMLVETE
jgi:hypothetical protein